MILQTRRQTNRTFMLIAPTICLLCVLTFAFQPAQLQLHLHSLPASLTTNIDCKIYRSSPGNTSQSCNFIASFKLNKSKRNEPEHDKSLITEHKDQSTNVPKIMDLLKRTYPEPSSAKDSCRKSATDKWTKTRKYLYQYRARTSYDTTINGDKYRGKTSAKSQRIQGPLTLLRVQEILSFLQNTFPNHPQLQAKILQNSPWILSQYHRVD